MRPRFDHAERYVVPSPPVRKALRRLESPAADGILAVGTVFTREALRRWTKPARARWRSVRAVDGRVRPGPPSLSGG